MSTWCYIPMILLTICFLFLSVITKFDTASCAVITVLREALFVLRRCFNCSNSLKYSLILSLCIHRYQITLWYKESQDHKSKSWSINFKYHEIIFLDSTTLLLTFFFTHFDFDLVIPHRNRSLAKICYSKTDTVRNLFFSFYCLFSGENDICSSWFCSLEGDTAEKPLVKLLFE